jgi:hypothetical protein
MAAADNPSSLKATVVNEAAASKAANGAIGEASSFDAVMAMNLEWATAANVAVAVLFTHRGHRDGSLLRKV